MKAASQENALLSKITLITNIGDFVSLFAIFKITHLITNDVLIAGYAVAVGSLATAIAGMLLPSALCRLSTRSLILITQGVSALVMLGLWICYSNQILLSPWSFLGGWFVITVLNEIFKASRETHSQNLSQDGEAQRGLTAELMASFYGAQFVGPIFAFFLLLLLPLWVALAVDTISFVLAFVYAFKLMRGPVYNHSMTFMKPLGYVFRRAILRNLFLLRSVYVWIPLGIFNVMVFPLITEKLNLGIEYSAWVYSLVGFGATMIAILLRSPRSQARNWISKKDDRGVAFAGLTLMALVTVGVSLGMGRFGSALLMVLFGGAMSLNAIATQSMRRRICSAKEFPEVVGLELIVGKLMEWFVVSVVVVYLGQWGLNVNGAFIVSGVALLLLALYVLQFKEEWLTKNSSAA